MVIWLLARSVHVLGQVVVFFPFTVEAEEAFPGHIKLLKVSFFIFRPNVFFPSSYLQIFKCSQQFGPFISFPNPRFFAAPLPLLRFRTTVQFTLKYTTQKKMRVSGGFDQFWSKRWRLSFQSF
jgi:hypothetical protein